MNITAKALGAYKTNCYILEKNGSSLIVDPGVGALEFCRHAPRPLAVLNTHGHFDHVWGNDEVSKTLSVPIYIHKDDEFLLKMDYFNLGMPPSRADFLVTRDSCLSAKGSKQRARVLDEAIFNANSKTEDAAQNSSPRKITIGDFSFYYFHAPGHTPGNSMIVFDDAIFSGDFIFKNAIGRYDFPFSNAHHMKQSLQNFLKTFTKDCPIYPGHGKPTSVQNARSFIQTVLQNTDF